jgi:single-stranded DNA-binding protein
MLVKGELQVRSYKDKDGNDRKAYEVIVDTAEFCESKKNTSQQENEAPTENTGDFQEVAGDELGDDLPF